MKAVDRRGVLVTAIEMAGPFSFNGLMLDAAVVICAPDDRYVVTHDGFTRDFNTHRAVVHRAEILQQADARPRA